MTVELISVGTEILLGNIVNTNAAYLAERCALLGLSCYHQSVVGDNEERLEEELRRALSRSDVVILSGGLGPTKDDLTKEVTAKVFGRELREDPHTRERIQEYFDRSGRKLTANNWKQAIVPVGSRVLDNHNGTAPGLILGVEVFPAMYQCSVMELHPSGMTPYRAINHDVKILTMPRLKLAFRF